MRGGPMGDVLRVGGLVVVMTAIGCIPSRGNKVGAFCSGDQDCENGVCYNNICLDPDGDEDQDGLKNGVEMALGTDPMSADSDGDGRADNLEVVDVNQPVDGDGDGIIDAVESSLPSADQDGDCLPDEFDPDNLVYTTDMSLLASVFCLNQGICAEQVDRIGALCTAGIVSCDYSDVVGFEEQETTCDGKDNDCDGDTDEDITSTEKGICFDLGVCGAAGAVIPRQCVGGKWVCQYSGVKDWEAQETRLDGLDNDCDGETDEGLAGLPCESTNANGTCKGKTKYESGGVVCTAPEPAPEVCDDIDNDCNGVTDEDLSSTTQGECSDKGVCGDAGVVITRHCESGTWVCEYQDVPGYEVIEASCDGLDNNCDGATDEMLVGAPCDLTNEYGTCPGATKCDGLGGTMCVGDAAAPETCDLLDNDCDGATDEDLEGLQCVNTNQWGSCPGLSTCDGVELKCVGETASREICDGQDNDCDGGTDEDEICLKTARVAGLVKDGLTQDAIVGAVVTVLADTGGSKSAVSPAAEELTDGTGAFKAYLKPGGYTINVDADGFRPVSTQAFLLEDADVMPLVVVMVPQTDPTEFINVCGRTRVGAASTGGAPIPGASVTLYGDAIGNALASDTSGPGGFYCIPGVASSGAGGTPFTSVALEAKTSGFLPGKAEDVPIVPDTILIVNLAVQPMPADAETLLDEDFEAGSGGWTVESSQTDVGWNLTMNGDHPNTAVGKCVWSPAANEDCAPVPDDPTDECAMCAQPTDPACIPQTGSLPNAYSGDGAFWFGNPDGGNYLPTDGDCVPLNGGTGGPVSGSLVSPPVSVKGFTGIFLSFYSAFEIESQDPQAPPGGFDWMLIEITVDGGSHWDQVGYLNPDVDANGAAYQPYSSAGFNAAPVWVNQSYDLKLWVGAESIQVRFRFDSKDENYNAFRGWMIDKVEIVGFGKS
ncbi:MAG: carboxypeptidase regulatory-like domain-containing protein [Deltaproteobacteria bacterium]|nr:carboxypeptidase regulatory-like domain-containing protein [Deltaproteobacteria bacterium]